MIFICEREMGRIAEAIFALQADETCCALFCILHRRLLSRANHVPQPKIRPLNEERIFL